MKRVRGSGSIWPAVSIGTIPHPKKPKSFWTKLSKDRFYFMSFASARSEQGPLFNGVNGKDLPPFVYAHICVRLLYSFTLPSDWDSCH